MTILINMAAKHDDSALVQAQFAGVLRDLCVSDEIATEIHQARARGRGRVGVRGRGRGRVRVRVRVIGLG